MTNPQRAKAALSLADKQKEHLQPPPRRFDLLALLPQYNRRIDDTGDLAAFVGCLQEVVDMLVASIDRMPGAFDIERAPVAALEAMLHDLGNPFSFTMTTIDARRLAGMLVHLYRQKGTARGIENAIRLFLGLQVAKIDCHIVTQDSEGIRVGGAAAPSLYTFDVVFDHPLTASQKQRIERLVDYLKPAHTHLGAVLAPPD